MARRIPSTSDDLTPDVFDFTDLANQATTTQFQSDIVQINGISTGAAISIDGAGAYDYRVCADNTCSGAPAFVNMAVSFANVIIRPAIIVFFKNAPYSSV